MSFSISWRGIQQRVVLLAVSCMAAIVIAEIGLRVGGIEFPILHRRNPNTGAIGVAGLVARWPGAVGEHEIRFNDLGLRDRDHSRVKPRDTVRVLVVGDSFVEALAVPVEETFWRRLPAALEDCPCLGGRVIEAMDFGVSGTGTGQQLARLEALDAWSFAPDVVVLAMFPFNDLRDNSFALSGSRLRTYYLLEGDRPVLDRSIRPPRLVEWVEDLGLYGTLVWIRSRSRLLQLAFEARRRLRAAATGRRRRASQVTAEASARHIFDAFGPPRDEKWQHAWLETEGFVAAMARRVAAHSAGFVLTVIPPAVRVSTNGEEALAKWASERDLTYAERRLSKLGTRLGVPTLSLGEAMAAEVADTGKPLYGYDSHFNRAGHAFVAAQLAPVICEHLGRSEIGTLTE